MMSSGSLVGVDFRRCELGSWTLIVADGVWFSEGNGEGDGEGRKKRLDLLIESMISKSLKFEKKNYNRVHGFGYLGTPHHNIISELTIICSNFLNT